MTSDDFDINFDFDKEYDFDPKILSGDDGLDDDIDLSQFSDEELGLKPDAADDGGEPLPEEEGDFDFDFDEFLATGETDGTFTDEEIPDDVPDFAKREHSRFDSAGYGVTPEFPSDAVPSDLDGEPPLEEDPDYPEEDVQEAPEEQDEPEIPEKPKRQRRERPKKEKKPAAPNIFTKFFDLYFAPVLHKELLEEPRDPNAPRRRRKSKAQIFKEAYLPALVVCVCMILVLSFTIGAVTNAIKGYTLERETKKSQLDSSISAAQQAETDAQIAMHKAEALATVYNYDEAITVLGDFLNSVEKATDFPELTAMRSEYVNIQSQLVSHQDPSLIPNLSFHVLIHDMAKAKQNTELGGLYNRNFVTTSEFTKILNDLYNNGFVLVDFNSFTTNNNGTILPKNINLPEGKKPIMLTETMVNYFQYMVDHDKDWVPDKDGDGFASKLVVDSNGDIKAEYVDSNGTTLTGDYDFVPILETFLKEHPDFSYQGARAILAVTGSEGIFGYRINSSFESSKGAAYREAQIEGAKTLVSALREKGYTLACFTYDNQKYGALNANQIQNDLDQWTQQITPVIGNVDVLVYARESDISDYGGNAFTTMSNKGFRYFVSNGTSPSTEVNTTYVRQKRLMVTGNTMQWNQPMFKDIFDPNTVIDLATRGNVPN